MEDNKVKEFFNKFFTRKVQLTLACVALIIVVLFSVLLKFTVYYNKLYGKALVQRPPDVKLMQHCQKEWTKTHKLMVKFGYLDY